MTDEQIMAEARAFAARLDGLRDDVRAGRYTREEVEALLGQLHLLRLALLRVVALGCGDGVWMRSVPSPEGRA